jgi:hypothetical protein
VLSTACSHAHLQLFFFSTAHPHAHLQLHSRTQDFFTHAFLANHCLTIFGPVGCIHNKLVPNFLSRRHTHDRWGRLLTLTDASQTTKFSLQTTHFFLPCSSRGALQVRSRADQRHQATCQHERSPWVRMCLSQGRAWDPRPLETKSLLISIRGSAPATVDDKLSPLTFPP